MSLAEARLAGAEEAVLGAASPEAQLAAAEEYIRQHDLISDRAVTAVLADFDQISYFGELPADFVTRASRTSVAAQRALASVLVGYLQAVTGQQAAVSLDAVSGDPTRLDGMERSWQIPFFEMWQKLGSGVGFEEARSKLRDEVEGKTTMDLALAQRDAMAEAIEGLDGIVGWRRVVSADACDFCVLVSEQRYHSQDLMEVHPHCRCTVAPIIGSSDPGQRINSMTAEEAERHVAEVEEKEAEREPAVNNRAETVPYQGFDKVSKKAAGEMRETIDRALGGIRPDIADQLSAVRIADPRGQYRDKRLPPTAIAWYVPGYRDTTIRQSAFSPKKGAETLVRALTPSARNIKDYDIPGGAPAWWPKTIDPKLPQSDTLPKVAMTHEIGHFLDYRLTPDQQAELREVIAKAAGVDALDPRAYYDAGLQVSRYASTSRAELIAEAWAEYKLAPEPRPVAKAIGDAILGYLG